MAVCSALTLRRFGFFARSLPVRTGGKCGMGSGRTFLLLLQSIVTVQLVVGAASIAMHTSDRRDEVELESRVVGWLARTRDAANSRLRSRLDSYWRIPREVL